MEKKQSELCLEILHRFQNAGILSHCILIGSWCVYFYRDYFSRVPFIDQSMIKTRDIDFLIENPRKIHIRTDIPQLLEDLGFLVDFKGNQGYIKLNHPDLILEFLVPESGKGTNKPYPLPQLGLNAQPLRMLGFLAKHTIRVQIDDITLTLPHPVNFALHKLLIYSRRKDADKALKDLTTAIVILNALIKQGKLNSIRQTYLSVPQTWQRSIINGLTAADAIELSKQLRLD
ncbi:MAG: GSU2403 family nucleotidyltransferase fold protein [bacterium]